MVRLEDALNQFVRRLSPLNLGTMSLNQRTILKAAPPPDWHRRLERIADASDDATRSGGVLPAMDLHLRETERFWLEIASPFLLVPLFRRRPNRGPALPAGKCSRRPAAVRSGTGAGPAPRKAENIL